MDKAIVSLFQKWVRPMATVKVDRVLASFPVIGRRNPIRRLEQPRKIERIIVAKLVGDFLYILGGSLEEFACAFHSQPDEEVYWSAAGCLFEKNEKMR